MSGDELEMIDVEDTDEVMNVGSERVRAVISMETRRKLEDRIEQRRLEKLIQDYDFDMD